MAPCSDDNMRSEVDINLILQVYSPRHIILNWRILLQKNRKIKMLQTAKNLPTGTRFHLWDVLKLKKRIIFHFGLFYSTIGHLKKKVQNLLKIAKISYFWNFKFWFAAGIGRESADIWPKGRFSPSLAQIFLCQTDKNWQLYLKKTYPPPKKRAFFFRGGGQEIGGR